MPMVTAPRAVAPLLPSKIAERRLRYWISVNPRRNLAITAIVLVRHGYLAGMQEC